MTPPIHPQHHDRSAIQAEAHSRPPLAIDESRSEAWHWVLKPSAEGEEVWPEPLGAAARHQVVEGEGWILRFERHTEFIALTYFGTEAPRADVLALIKACPGKQIAGARIVITPDDSAMKMLSDHRLFGAQVAFAGVSVATDFLVSNYGMVVYAVCGDFEDGFARGRLVKRLLDLETYRTVSLLGLPMVREMTPKLEEIEHQANCSTTAISQQTQPLEAAIHDLAEILRDVSALKGKISYRIAASRAYFSLVNDRLESLEEQQIGQRQTLRGFVKHRLDPGIMTIMAFERRINNITEQVSESLALARTQLEQSSQQQSQALLASMEQSTRQQVHLAQSVEGLSVAAITYYTVGILAYAVKAVPALAANKDTIIALSIVPIGVMVWLLTRWTTQKILSD